MGEAEIRLTDIGRLLFGEAPPLFLLEVFVRTLVMYVALLLVLQWLGKRMSGEISIMEMTIMILLGAIISVPMQVPESGVLHGVLILLCVLGLYTAINRASVETPVVERLTQGVEVVLVKDGVMQLDDMEKARISRQQLFAVLRTRGIFTLGDVRRVYLEACGLFSVFRREHPVAGLPVFPPDDHAILQDRTAETSDVQACERCGYVQRRRSSEQVCDKCGNTVWTTTTLTR